MSTTLKWAIALLSLCSLLTACGDSRSPEQVLADANQKIEALSYRSAIIELRSLLKDNPDNLGARLSLARALLEVGDYDTADKELARAQDLNATQEQFAKLLAEVYMARGEFAQLLAEIDPSKVDPPALSSELKALRANAMLALGSRSDATKIYEQVLADGESTEAQRIALLGLASVAERSADYTKAEKLARQSLEIAPDSAESYLRVGQYIIVQTRFDEAISFLSEDGASGVRMSRMERFRWYGERTQAFLGAAKYDEARESANVMNQISPSHPMSGFLLGQVEFRSGNLDTALETVQDVVAKFPTFVPAKALLGAISLERGDYEQAEEYLSAAIAAEPGNASTRQLLAATRMRMERPEDAAQTLREGMRNGASNASVLAMLGNATVQQGQSDEGVALLQQALEAEPDNAQAAISLASAYVARGERSRALDLINSLPDNVIEPRRREILTVVASFDERNPSAAQRKLESLLSEAPHDVELLGLAGGFYLTTGDTPKARDAYEKIIDIDPLNRAGLTGILRVEERTGDYARTRELFSAALRDNPNEVFPHLVLARIEEVAGNHGKAIELVRAAHGVDETALQPNLVLSSEALNNGDFGAADRHARLALTHHPDVARSQLAMGLVHVRQQEFDQSLPYLNRAVSLDPDNYFNHYQLGAVQSNIGQLAQARSSFREAYRLNPEHLASLRSLAILEIRAGDSRRADELLREARASVGDGPVLDELTGDIRASQKKFSEALAAYQRAFAANQTWPLVRKRFAMLGETGAPDVTLPLRNWLKDNPRHIPARVLLAQTYLRVNDRLNAIEQYEMVIIEQPESAFALNNLAWLYLNEAGPDNQRRALEMATKAHRLAPLNFDIADTLGWVQFNNGRLNESVDTLREAMSSTTPRRSPDIAYHLAAVLQESGSGDEAREILIRALSATRPFENRAAAEQLLETL
ncbi:MAG: XrtA/PEP-CTERM system TPR-repeat protein PrsT [Pseudomonadota bacterium]